MTATGVAAQQDPFLQSNPMPFSAGTAEGAPVATPFVTLDQEALFLNSQYGQRIQADLERQRNDLATENREIGAELIAEEQDLTAKRKTLTAQEFAPLAAAFDDKVQKIRTDQERKSQTIQQMLETERQNFLQQLGPVLADLMRERGAIALIDRKAVLLAIEDVDITQAAIEAMDAHLQAESLQDDPELTPIPTETDPAPDSE
ncbi:OmpH family outer membrane protein [Pseudoruegeria sp. SK021]|uniref:OmpH family outer membrane protein n=1 Tax=Pseudoruegeria sp. SK021 TaxID=1933035 RepID=UPI00143CF409|nr:OmpH family outer membrane protein [Pseudoruegeria sp. SK021]